MRVVAIQSLSAEDLSAWGRLAGRAVEPNPFFEPLFVPAAARALGAADVKLLIAGDGEEWSGCMPVQVRRVLGRPIFASTWKHPYSFLSTPLVDRDRVEEFAASVIRSLREREHCGSLLLRRASDGPVLAALRAAAEDDGKLGPVFERCFERGAYERRPEGEQLSWMKSRRRSELKRQRKKLAEELGEEVASHDRSDTAEAVDTFLRLEASGWKGEEGTAMASSEHSADLFRSMCEEFAAAGRLQLRSLEAGGETLAMTCDIGADGTLFGFKAAYDERLRRYSPGIQLQVDNFAFFDSSREEAQFDSCAEPGNETINGLWPDRKRVVTIAFGRTGPAGKLLGRVLDATYEARNRRGSAAGLPSPRKR